MFIIGLAISALTYAAPPSFSMAFSPTTIGPGSNSTLTFTIDNTAEMTTVSGLSFYQDNSTTFFRRDFIFAIQPDFYNKIFLTSFVALFIGNRP